MRPSDASRKIKRQRHETAGEDETRVSSLEEKRRKLLRRGDWVGTSIQKPLAIVFPAQSSPSRKGKWGFRRQDDRSDNGWRQTFAHDQNLSFSQGRHPSASQKQRIKVTIGSQTIRSQLSPTARSYSSTKVSSHLRSDSTRSPLSSPKPSSGILHIESSPATLHQPVPQRFAQLHRFRQSSSVGSTTELQRPSSPPLQDHSEETSDTDPESFEDTGEVLSERIPDSETVPAIFDGISSSDCESSPTPAVEEPPSQLPSIDADVSDAISMLAQASAPDSSPEAASGFTFVQPRPFKGRLARTPAPEKRPVVQLSVTQAPRRGRPKQKARDGRISIRGIGDYYDDPIE